MQIYNKAVSFKANQPAPTAATPSQQQPVYPAYTQPQAVRPNVQNLQALTIPYANTYFNKFATPRNAAAAKTQGTQAVTNKTDKPFVYKNDLRQMFQQNKAVIYAMVVRTFNAKDKDGNELIEKEKGEQTSTFLTDIDRLDELKALGVNTIHMLPINPPGKTGALGTGGSVYAPLDYATIDPALDDPNNPMDVYQEAKKFTDEAHKRGIKVMLDLPSCASLDLYNNRQDLMAIDELGRPKVPGGWMDIRMFNPWKDEEKRQIHEGVYKEYEKFVDMSLKIGVDGIRADVARAKPPEFWDRLINYTRTKDPNFAFLAETYCYEDASPMANVQADRPEDLLKAGFDSYYGQFHIFHSMKDAKEFNDYVIENLNMSQRLEPGKSLIGSFTTHDDISPMNFGGVEYCNLTMGLQSTLPMTNPYVISGFESGDRYNYAYGNKIKDGVKLHVNDGMLDIFNLSRKPGGEHPEVGKFMSNMMNVRHQYEDVITKGSFIPLNVKGNKENQIIAYARHQNGKTLLVVANKDVNAVQKGRIEIPTLKGNQPLKDLTVPYGIPSKYAPDNNELNVELGPARVHVFEIDTPNIEACTPSVFKQKLAA